MARLRRERDMSPLREGALALLGQGFSVIPIAHRSKRPTIRWKEYQTTPPTVAQVAKWWASDPEQNVGIVTGKVSRLTVIDYDPRNDPTGSTGTWLRAELEEPTVTTGTGGAHWYVREVWPTLPRLRPGLDVKGTGGYVLAPPSVHPNGRAYEWVGGAVTFATLSAGLRGVIEGALAEKVIASSQQGRERIGNNNPDDQLTLREILDLLEYVRPTSTGWIARCPAHEDGSPSLSVGYSRTGRALLHCFGGCAFVDILRALRERQNERIAEEGRKIVEEMRITMTNAGPRAKA